MHETHPYVDRVIDAWVQELLVYVFANGITS